MNNLHILFSYTFANFFENPGFRKNQTEFSFFNYFRSVNICPLQKHYGKARVPRHVCGGVLFGLCGKHEIVFKIRDGIHKNLGI